MSTDTTFDPKRRALRPDAQAFDEVIITTVPRFKESGLSGSEWRICAEVKLKRKCQTVFARSYSTVEMACAFLPGLYHTAIDDGHAFFGGEGPFCDQEGCSERWTVAYRRKHEYCREGHKSEVSEISRYRCFCERHRRRGDQSYDDSDANYELVEFQKAGGWL